MRCTHLVPGVHVPEEGLKLGPSWDAHVQRLCCDEGLGLKEVEVVAVPKVGEQLPSQPGAAKETSFIDWVKKSRSKKRNLPRYLWQQASAMCLAVTSIVALICSAP